MNSFKQFFEESNDELIIETKEEVNNAEVKASQSSGIRSSNLLNSLLTAY